MIGIGETHVYAQTSTTNPTSQPVANLTITFKTDKQLQFCLIPSEIADLTVWSDLDNGIVLM